MRLSTRSGPVSVRSAMPRFRLAHFSDVHYTVNPFANLPEGLRGKRLASCVGDFFTRRRARFRNSDERIGALLEDIDQAGVDHALCTGDLTSISLDAEFEGLARVFGSRLTMPDRYTVIPGNHDRYVPSAVRGRAFERFFARLCGGGDQFPFAKRLGAGLRVVAIDVSRPTSVTDSSGLCGPAQRTTLARILSEDDRSPTLVAMHYGLLRSSGNEDHLHHRMRDATDILKILNESPARIAIILHGHMHTAFTVHSGRHTIICAGSATDLAVDCGYCIYDIDLDTLAVHVQRRCWNRRLNRYEAVDTTALNDAVQSRRGVKLAMGH